MVLLLTLRFFPNFQVALLFLLTILLAVDLVAGPIFEAVLLLWVRIVCFLCL